MKLLRGSLVVVLWALSCGDDGNDLDRGTASQIWCRGVCTSVRRCAALNSSGCEEECVAERPGLSKFSLDGARALRPCLSELSCEELTTDALWDEALDACWERAREQVDVSSHARSFCTPYVEAWFECGDYWSVAACERVFSMWSDAVIDRFEPCLAAAGCADLKACDESTWGGL